LLLIKLPTHVENFVFIQQNAVVSLSSFIHKLYFNLGNYLWKNYQIDKRSILGDGLGQSLVIHEPIVIGSIWRIQISGSY
jgi:hypothetical protein